MNEKIPKRAKSGGNDSLEFPAHIPKGTSGGDVMNE